MSRIKELLKDNNSVLVFDVDGVLAVLEFGERNHFGLNDEEWIKHENAVKLQTRRSRRCLRSWAAIFKSYM